MTRLIKLLLARLRRLWPVSAPPPIGDNLPPRKGVPRKPEARENDAFRNETMSHYYLDDLLGDLDLYFESLARMRRTDRDGYGLYRQIGAEIVPQYAKLLHPADLPATWRDGSDRPGGGMVHFECSNQELTKKQRMAYQVFASYRKIKQHAYIEPCSDDIFEVKTYYKGTKINGGKLVHGSYFVAVDKAGAVRQLKQLVERVERPPHSRRRLRSHRGKTEIRTRCFGYPEWWIDKDAKENWDAVEYFRAIVSANHYAGDGFQVRVRRSGGLTGRFNISLLRTPYFFKDRDKTVTVNGATKRIFHIVRAHKRITAGGAERWVRTHFRGLRRFTWHDYAVVISMPGYHHIMLDEFSPAAVICDDADQVEGYGGDQVGKMLDHLMDDNMMKRGSRRAFDAALAAAGMDKEPRP